MSWVDFRPTDSRDIAAISACFADSIGEVAAAVCVEVLAQMPKEAASKWRTQALHMAAVSREYMIVQGFP